MKKIFGFLPLLLISVMCIAVTACSDDDDDAVIGKNELPAAMTSFVSTYFPSQEINVSQKDNDGYEVMLSDGTMIDFNRRENGLMWMLLSAKRFLPASILPRLTLILPPI